MLDDNQIKEAVRSLKTNRAAITILINHLKLLRMAELERLVTADADTSVRRAQGASKAYEGVIDLLEDKPKPEMRRAKNRPL